MHVPLSRHWSVGWRCMLLVLGHAWNQMLWLRALLLICTPSAEGWIMLQRFSVP
uniref:Uncharacterized protein n=1 Tax=Arundo donax TaxID=35708 RepID=A0A0A9HR94_ARUDO